MGAINKETLKYEYSKIASKSNKYKCPSCEKDVIFRKGKIKQSHYAHKKSDNPCYYYDRPNESQIHKDAKMLMKILLDNKTNMTFHRKCYNCHEDPGFICEITKDTYTDITTAVIEYKFQYNNSTRSADVALVENGNIKYIFEICYKNRTREDNRPEPWVEINAETFINKINSTNGKIEIECKREYKCNSCEDKDDCDRKQYYNMLERMRIKEKEQDNEIRELFNMRKEDERTIQIQQKIKLEREEEILERENLKKQLELEKEQERKRLEEEYNENRRKETEYLKKLLEQNNTCFICKINYCKCDEPNFIMDKYNRTICATCNRIKCKCIKITHFFKR